jgi:hypothetical protein
MPAPLNDAELARLTRRIDELHKENRDRLARFDELRLKKYSLGEVLDDLLHECQAVSVKIKDAWAKQTDGPDLWPIFDRLRSAIDLAKEASGR